MLCGNAVISTYKEKVDTLIKGLYMFAKVCSEQFKVIDVFILESQTAFLANKWLEGAIYGVFYPFIKNAYTVTISKNRTITALSTHDCMFEYHKNRKVRKLDCRNKVMDKIKKKAIKCINNCIIDVNAKRFDCTDAFLLIFMPVKSGP